MQEIMLEFRAGKMFFEGKRVVPDTRKGLVRIAKGEEGLIHFQWLVRDQADVEDDQIIFPDEAVFEKVNQASGRVYILKFNSDNRKFFFWMQEPKAEGDFHLCSSVNYYINQPLDMLDVHVPAASTPLEDARGAFQDVISSRGGNSVIPSSDDEMICDADSLSGPVKLEDLQRILRNIKSEDMMENLDGGLGLGDILKPDLILPLIETLPLQERLASYLPKEEWTPENVLDLFQSPPFRRQLDSFTDVLRTGQIDLAQFEIDPSKCNYSISSFLEALEDSVTKVSGQDEQEKDDHQSKRRHG